jgi:hypothetical protein
MKSPKFDWRIERDPDRKGTLRRRLDDAFRAMHDVKLSTAPSEVIAFIFYWVACEKVAKVIIAIKRKKSAIGDLDFKSKKKWHAGDLFEGCRLTGLDRVVSRAELEQIFSKADDRFTAAALRDRLFHDFGPAHVSEVARTAQKLNPLMRKFLSCKSLVADYMDGQASGVSDKAF